jgi:ABC-2 type transport system permease protein
MIIRSSFYLVILYIFSKLWQATQFTEANSHESMIWYLAITELIVLSIPLIQSEIENDIRSGDIVYQVLKPIDYLWLKVAESTGAFLFRFTVLVTLAIPYCYYLSGVVPKLCILISSLLCAALGTFVFIIFQTAIGLTAFILQDSSPVYWLWQRSSFLFGGMLIPLSFYPVYLKTFAYMLPFASLLYAPARLILDFSINHFFITLAGISFWGLIAFMLSNYLYYQLLKSLKVNGG